MAGTGLGVTAGVLQAVLEWLWEALFDWLLRLPGVLICRWLDPRDEPSEHRATFYALTFWIALIGFAWVGYACWSSLAGVTSG